MRNQNLKKCLALIISIIMLTAAIPAGAMESDLIIHTYEGLLQFADAVNLGTNYAGKTIKLGANINLGGESNPWTPVGTNSSKNFNGTFDGQNHVISGLYISATTSYQGFFGYLGSSAYVKNLTVKGEINTTSSDAAGIAGYNSGKIEHCRNEVTVTATGSGTNFHAGIAGENYGGIIQSCVNAAAVSGIGAVGGIVGRNMSGTASILNCYNTGNIAGTSGQTGGICGQSRTGTPNVNHCYNTGSVSVLSGTNIGAIIGQLSNGNALNNYYLSGSAENGFGTTSVETFSAMEKTQAEMTDAGFPALLGDAFTQDTTQINDGYPVFSWQLYTDASEPVSPVFIETIEKSKTLAGYIRGAINAKKTSAGLLPTDSLLSNFDGSSTGTDWIAVTMGAYGLTESNGNIKHLYPDGDGYTQFLQALKSDISQRYLENGGVLDINKATEWHRVTLAIQALGGDPTHFGTYNGSPINLIEDGTYNNNSRDVGPGYMGINGWIYGLLALDTKNYEVPADALHPREKFVEEILKLQLTDGVDGNFYSGWALSGGASDPDISAMAIQALAPYYFDDTAYTFINSVSKAEVTKTVREAVEEALAKLSYLQRSDGGFASWGTVNCESTSQVLAALCALGIDPATDPRFIKSGKTLLDGILKYRNTGGGFGHTNTTFDPMATDQASYAIAAYWRYVNGLRSLYDYRGDFTPQVRENIVAAKAAIDNLPDSMDSGYKTALKSALSLYREVTGSERRYVYNYAKLMSAIDSVGGESELDNDNPYITQIEVTTLPDKTEYIEDDAFDTAGMVVTAYYSNGTNAPISNYTCLPGGKLSLSDTVVIIISGPYRATVSITIAERPLWEGEGTPAVPYLISSLEGLTNLQDHVNTKVKATTGLYFKLTKNINLNSIANWTPIGNSEAKAFQGTFDGGGYAIENLKTIGSFRGLFGYVGDNAVIKSLGIAGGTAGSGITNSFVGGIAGWSNGADFINCYNSADISGSYSGGIVGTVRNGTGNITDCYNEGTITGDSVGGIVGHLQTGNENFKVTVTNCYNNGTVTGNDDTADFGGIAGRIQGGGHTVNNCYNVGSLGDSGYNFGSIIGQLTSGSSAYDCWYLKAGDTVGIGDGTDATLSKTAEEMKSPAFLEALGNSFKGNFVPNINHGYPILAWQEIPAVKSSDTSLKLVKIGDYTARLTDDTIYTVKLPENKKESFAAIEATDENAAVSMPLANADYTQWNFSVTAEDGTITDYTIQVTALRNISLIAGISIYEPWVDSHIAEFEITSHENKDYHVFVSVYKGDALLRIVKTGLSVKNTTDIYPVNFSALSDVEFDSLKILIWDKTYYLQPVTSLCIISE